MPSFLTSKKNSIIVIEKSTNVDQRKSKKQTSDENEKQKRTYPNTGKGVQFPERLSWGKGVSTDAS
jgi:hypothetical protein